MQQRRKKYSLSDLIQQQGGLQSGGLQSGGKYTWNDFKNTMGKVGKVAMKVAPGALSLMGQPELALLATGANALTGHGLLIGGCDPYCGGALTPEQRAIKNALSKQRRLENSSSTGRYNDAHRVSAKKHLGQMLRLIDAQLTNDTKMSPLSRRLLTNTRDQDIRMVERFKGKSKMPHLLIDEYNYSLYPPAPKRKIILENGTSKGKSKMPLLLENGITPEEELEDLVLQVLGSGLLIGGAHDEDVYALQGKSRCEKGYRKYKVPSCLKKSLSNTADYYTPAKVKSNARSDYISFIKKHAKDYDITYKQAMKDVAENGLWGEHKIATYLKKSKA